MTINSPSARTSRLENWEASQQQPAGSNGPGSQDVKRSRSVTPPRSGGESEDEDEDFYFNDNDSTCSGSEEPSQPGKGTWTREEHKRFLEAIKIYVNGPWKLVAEYVGTRTVRQTMTHAQKYRQKAARRIRGLRTKQAIMRMHHGHEVSEESMVQEQLRTMLGQSRHAYLPPELVAQLNYSPSASPVGSPVMPGSPVLHGGSIPGSPGLPRSPNASPFMPSSPVGSPFMPSSPVIYSNDSMLPSLPSLTVDNSLLPDRLETPLSITIRSTPMTNDTMPVYAPASPHSSFSSSPATSPVSALTAQMAQHALASRMDYDLDIIEGNNLVPTLEECANVLMDVLFDEQAIKEETAPQPEPGAPFDIDI